MHQAQPAALGARVGNDDALATALRARGAHREKALPPFHLPNAAAGIASGGLCARGGAFAKALDARLGLVELQHFLGAGNDFLQADLNVVTQVGAGSSRRASAAPAAAEAEQFLENAAKA